VPDRAAAPPLLRAGVCRQVRGAAPVLRLVSPSRTTSTGDLRGALSFPPTASLTWRTRSAICPVCSAAAPMSTFFITRESFFDVAFVALRPGSGRPSDLLDLVARPRAIPPAAPASPTPVAIAGVFNCLAADATALPAVFAPLTVASLAVSIVLLLLGDLRVLCLEDAVRRGVARDWLPFDDGRVRERDFVVVAPFDRDLRALVRFPFELRLGLLFVCWAITQILSLAPEPANYPRGRTAIRKLRIFLPIANQRDPGADFRRAQGIAPASHPPAPPPVNSRRVGPRPTRRRSATRARI
jgi:hypothetical protein